MPTTLGKVLVPGPRAGTGSLDMWLEPEGGPEKPCPASVLRGLRKVSEGLQDLFAQRRRIAVVAKDMMRRGALAVK
jgi:hypothetical protein